MGHCNTIFSQLLKLVARHEFETLAKQHHTGRSFRRASRWGQFVDIDDGQLSGRHSLRDLVDNMSTQLHRLYYLGCNKISRSNLSRINEDKPYTLYETLFNKLLNRCQALHRNIIFVLKIYCIHWIHQPLIFVYRFSHGLTFEQSREYSL